MLSIIIPVYNESKHIYKTLDHLSNTLNTTIPSEIIIVDGSSIDNTIEIINTFKKNNTSLNISIYTSNKGRSIQMNHGANKALHNILYFLHADSLPPNNFNQLILQEISKNNLAGCFKMKFDWNHWWLKLAGWLTKFNYKFCRGGDQSLFIDKNLFFSLNGYREDYIIYEDNILISELYKQKQFTVIQKNIITSARLYKEIGLWKLQYYFFLIYFKKWKGEHPNNLYLFYKNKISEKRREII